MVNEAKNGCGTKHLYLILAMLGVFTFAAGLAASYASNTISKVDAKLDGSIAERKAMLNSQDERIRILEREVTKFTVTQEEMIKTLSRIEKKLDDHTGIK